MIMCRLDKRLRSIKRQPPSVFYEKVWWGNKINKSYRQAYWLVPLYLGGFAEAIEVSTFKNNARIAVSEHKKEQSVSNLCEAR